MACMKTLSYVSSAQRLDILPAVAVASIFENHVLTLDSCYKLHYQRSSVSVTAVSRVFMRQEKPRACPLRVLDNI